MPYVLVETTEEKPGHFSGWAGPRDMPYRRESSTTIAHSIWRCYSCRALAVTKRGEKISGRCAKCGR